MSYKTPIAINGFGRIGRRLFRLLHGHPRIEVVAINDLADAETLAHLLKYDSVHGIFSPTVSHGLDCLIVDGREIPLQNATRPDQCRWRGVEVVVESSGKFKTTAELQQHLTAGAERVILSVPPADDGIKMVVLGVNEHILTPDDRIVSNASCTTNNAAHLIQLVNQLCGVEQAYITTVHSYTTDQSLHDKPHRDLRRARAATQSIIPTTTGAAKALTKIFPELSDAIGGCGIRVPVPNGSLTDITLNVKKQTDIQTLNTAFKNAADNQLKGILQYTEDPLVSVDILGNTHSCVFDAQMTSVIGQMVKLIGWYDNETGYSARLIDLIEKVSGR